MGYLYALAASKPRNNYPMSLIRRMGAFSMFSSSAIFPVWCWSWTRRQVAQGRSFIRPGFPKRLIGNAGSARDGLSISTPFRQLYVIILTIKDQL